MVYYGDCHPDVESCAKTVYPTDVNHSGTNPLVGSCDLITSSFFNEYSLIWFLNASSRFVSIEGHLLTRKEEILANQDSLPAKLSIITLVWDDKFGLMAQIPEFFSEKKYKACEFDN